MQLYHTKVRAMVIGRKYGTIQPTNNRYLSMPAGIAKAEAALLTLPQAEAPVFHHFAPGLYIREVHFPKGCIAIGHEQRFPQWNIFLKGKVRMINEDGSSTILEAPMQFVGPAGRKIGEILEDVVWQNVYATEETDIEKLEAHFIVKSEHWQQEEQSQKSKLFLQHVGDRRDYRRILQEWGIPESQARAESERDSDLIPFPLGSHGVKLGQSPIEGRGLFATRNFLPGEVVAPARIGDKRTPAGRYTNHAREPNCEFQLQPNGDLHLVAIRPIRGCLAGFDGEEVTINYRHALELAGRTKRSLPCPQQQQ